MWSFEFEGFWLSIIRDTFTGAYATEYVRQKITQDTWDIEKAVIRACKASAVTICTLGAQDGIPWADEIDIPTVDSNALVVEDAIPVA